MTWSKNCTGDPQILRRRRKNIFAAAIWHPRFVHPCFEYFLTRKAFRCDNGSQALLSGKSCDHHYLSQCGATSSRNNQPVAKGCHLRSRTPVGVADFQEFTTLQKYFISVLKLDHIYQDQSRYVVSQRLKTLPVGILQLILVTGTPSLVWPFEVPGLSALFRRVRRIAKNHC